MLCKENLLAQSSLREESITKELNAVMSSVTAIVWEMGSKQFPSCFRNIYEWIDHCKKGNLEWRDKMIPIEETVGSDILVLIVIFDSVCHCQHSHSL